MRIPGATVHPSARHLSLNVADFLHGSAIGAEPVSHDMLWSTIALHQFSEEFQCRLAVSSLGNKGIQHFTFVVDGASHVVDLAVDFDENLVEMPLPVGPGLHPLNAGASDF